MDRQLGARVLVRAGALFTAPAPPATCGKAANSVAMEIESCVGAGIPCPSKEPGQPQVALLVQQCLDCAGSPHPDRPKLTPTSALLTRCLTSDTDRAGTTATTARAGGPSRTPARAACWSDRSVPGAATRWLARCGAPLTEGCPAEGPRLRGPSQGPTS